MLSVGQRLRQQREHQKISLDAIAERTKISTRYLQAIETENFQDLPSGLFRRSFIRQYARALSLDDAALDSELDEMFGSGEAGRTAISEASPAYVISVDPLPAPGAQPRSERRTGWSVGLLVFALVACSGIYALWERTQHVGAEEGNAPVPQLGVEAGPAPHDVVSAAPLETQPAATQPDPSQQAAPPEASRSLSQDPPRPTGSATAQSAVQTQATPPPPNATSPASGRSTVEIIATEQVWVRVTDGRRTVFSGTLRPQQSRKFEGLERAKVLTGNAGGLDIHWNGKSIGPVGPSGQVRVVEFTPEAYLILSP